MFGQLTNVSGIHRLLIGRLRPHMWVMGRVRQICLHCTQHVSTQRAVYVLVPTCGGGEVSQNTLTSKDKERAEMVANFSISVFTEERLGDIPPIQNKIVNAKLKEFTTK